MKKTYQQPLMEVMTLDMENLLNQASVGAIDGIDVTPGQDKPTEFAKEHSSIWGFDDEE